MELRDHPVSDPREAIAREREEVIDLLAGLSAEEWVAPTEAGHWRVKDVALHLLDDELGSLSRSRDGDVSGLLPHDVDHDDFVRSLDAKNERWVAGAAGLSREVVLDLIRWTGRQVDDYFSSIDLDAPSGVIWASDGSVPRWFDLCRDLTERWVHQQHIRDAVGQPGTHERLLPQVLSTFVWAFPHQYRVEPPFGEAELERRQREAVAGGVLTWDAVPADVLDRDAGLHGRARRVGGTGGIVVDLVEPHVQLGLLIGGEARLAPAEHEAVGRVLGPEHARGLLQRQAEVLRRRGDGGLGRERRRGGRRARRPVRDERAVHADDAAGGRHVGAEARVVDLDVVNPLAEVEVRDAVVAADVLVRDGHVGEVRRAQAERGAARLEVREDGAERFALRQRQGAARGDEEKQK